MDPTFIAERGNEIEALTRLQWRPKQVYTYLTKDGKTLDHAGKMKVGSSPAEARELLPPRNRAQSRTRGTAA